jgi:hypothetical protein
MHLQCITTNDAHMGYHALGILITVVVRINIFHLSVVALGKLIEVAAHWITTTLPV